jgi:hypothetical protein
MPPHLWHHGHLQRTGRRLTIPPAATAALGSWAGISITAPAMPRASRHHGNWLLPQVIAVVSGRLAALPVALAVPVVAVVLAAAAVVACPH